MHCGTDDERRLIEAHSTVAIDTEAGISGHDTSGLPTAVVCRSGSPLIDSRAFDFTAFPNEVWK